MANRKLTKYPKNEIWTRSVSVSPTVMDTQHRQGEGLSQEAGEGQSHRRLDQRDLIWAARMLLPPSEKPRMLGNPENAEMYGCSCRKWRCDGKTNMCLLSVKLPPTRIASRTSGETGSSSVPHSSSTTIRDKCNPRPERWRTESALDARTRLIVPNVPLWRRRFSSTTWMYSLCRLHRFLDFFYHHDFGFLSVRSAPSSSPGGQRSAGASWHKVIYWEWMPVLFFFFFLFNYLLSDSNPL